VFDSRFDSPHFFTDLTWGHKNISCSNLFPALSWGPACPSRSRAVDGINLLRNLPFLLVPLKEVMIWGWFMTLGLPHYVYIYICIIQIDLINDTMEEFKVNKNWTNVDKTRYFGGSVVNHLTHPKHIPVVPKSYPITVFPYDWAIRPTISHQFWQIYK
jgi:hypothetical protein